MGASTESVEYGGAEYEPPLSASVREEVANDLVTEVESLDGVASANVSSHADEWSGARLRIECETEQDGALVVVVPDLQSLGPQLNNVLGRCSVVDSVIFVEKPGMSEAGVYLVDVLFL